MFEGQSSHLPLKLTPGRDPASSRPHCAAAGYGRKLQCRAGAGLAELHHHPLSLGGRCSCCSSSHSSCSSPFYTAVVLNPTETADNLKNMAVLSRNSPGERTAESSTTFSRASRCRRRLSGDRLPIPEMLTPTPPVPFLLGGTSLLIVVSVTMDTVAQIQGYLWRTV